MKRTLAEIARLIGKPSQTVGDWPRQGLKSTKVGRSRMVADADLIAFLASREGYCSSQRERLAKVRADAIELQLNRTRRLCVYTGHVKEFLAAMQTDLVARHAAIPDRLADIAGMTDSALVRDRVMDEMRRVRAEMANTAAVLADKAAAQGD